MRGRRGFVPIGKSAIKHMRQTVRRTLRNKAAKATLRTALKKARAEVATASPEAARAASVAVTPAIDRAVAKGVLHRNTAARYKSRLARRANARASGSA